MPIEELTAFFAGRELPETINLNSAVRIGNVKDFVRSHISVLNHNPGKVAFQAFYDRLRLLKELLSEGRS